MKRCHIFRYILLLSIFLLSLILSACASKSSVPTNSNSDSSNLTITPATSDINDPADIATPSPQKITDTPPPADRTKLEEGLSIRGVTISLGETKNSVIKKLGYPNRIDTTEFNYNYYIYNNDYSKLVFFAVSKDKVVGFYTDSLDFVFHDIHSGSSLQTVNKALSQTFQMDHVLTRKNDTYTIKVLMDQLRTNKVTGIYVMLNSIKRDKKFSETAMNDIALMVYDLSNSIRARNGKPLLSWSSSAALCSKKHSIDMAEKDYFNRNSLIGRTPNDRMTSEGIYSDLCRENIIAGYGTAIFSVHEWFNSDTQRRNILNPKLRYVGVGFSYNKKSTYKTYITQDFYR